MALTNFVKNIRNIMRNDAGINGDAQRIEQIAWMLFLKVYDEKENDWEFNEDNYQSFIPENCRWRNWAKDEGDGNALTAGKLLTFVNDTLFPTLKNLEVTPYAQRHCPRNVRGCQPVYEGRRAAASGN